MMRRPYPFEQNIMFEHPYNDVANQLDSSFHISLKFNRKRQRRQAAAIVVESLWNNNGNNASNNSGNKGNATTARKSTAQPRPVLNIPPRGIGPIADPNENDVLCGRGGRINSHAGNVQFRDIINSKKKAYLAPTTKKLEKAHIAAGVVNDIRTMNPPGRFLKEDSGTGMWYDIGDAKAIKKTGQALREDAPDIRPAIDADGGSSGDEKQPATAKSGSASTNRGLSPNRSPRTNERRDHAIAGQQQNLQPIWPQQQGNGNNMIQTQMSPSDYHAQMSMPPPFMPHNTNNDNSNNVYSSQQPLAQNQQNFMRSQHAENQPVFQARNIPIQFNAEPRRSMFANQLYSGTHSTTNKITSASRRAMEALSQAGPTASQQQQYAPYARGQDYEAFGMAFHDPNGQRMSDDNTVSTISGLSEPFSSTIGSGMGTSSNLMNMSLKSNFSLTNSLRQSSRGTNNSMAMSGFGLSGSIKSGFGGSLTRSNSFPDMGSIVEGSDNWKYEGQLNNNLDEIGEKPKIGHRNSSGMSISSLMDLQSTASSTQWLAAAGLSYQDDKSYLSSANMSTDLDALDLASSSRLNF